MEDEDSFYAYIMRSTNPLQIEYRKIMFRRVVVTVDVESGERLDFEEWCCTWLEAMDRVSKVRDAQLSSLAGLLESLLVARRQNTGVEHELSLVNRLQALLETPITDPHPKPT